MRNASIKKFEELGFTVDKDKQGYQVQQYTPAGQDWSLYFKDLQDIEDFAVNFNPYEENKILLENKHRGDKSLPSVAKIWEDLVWQNRIVMNLLEWIQDLKKPMSYSWNEILISYSKRGLGDYHFFVRIGGVSHWACSSWRTLKRWLNNRNLKLKPKNHDMFGYHKVIGNFVEDYCWSVAELERLKKDKNGFFFTIVSNGDKTKAVSYQENGKTVIVRCNPNVHDRPVYDYFSMAEEVRLDKL